MRRWEKWIPSFILVNSRGHEAESGQGFSFLIPIFQEPSCHHVLVSDLLPPCCYFSQCPLFVLNEDREHLVTSYLCKKVLMSLFNHPSRLSSSALLNFILRTNHCLSLKQDTSPSPRFIFTLNPFHTLTTLLWVFENGGSRKSCIGLISYSNLVSLSSQPWLMSTCRAWHQIPSSASRGQGPLSFLMTVVLTHTNPRPTHIRRHPQ